MLVKTYKPPFVTTIVLTWNSADFVRECLDSLLGSSYKTKILVVDNNSIDKTRDIVTLNYPEIELINTGDNLGYAGGNNFGINHMKGKSGEYIFIINPDATVDKECIKLLVERMKNEKTLAGASPMIY